jgi:hypothetical protein
MSNQQQKDPISMDSKIKTGLTRLGIAAWIAWAVYVYEYGHAEYGFDGTWPGEVDLWVKNCLGDNHHLCADLGDWPRGPLLSFCEHLIALPAYVLAAVLIVRWIVSGFQEQRQ